MTTTNSPVFADWLARDRSLTGTEYRILEAFASRFGQWVPIRAVGRALRHRQGYRAELDYYDVHAVRVHLSRIRRKLEPTPWRIENQHAHGLYRLVQR